MRKSMQSALERLSRLYLSLEPTLLSDISTLPAETNAEAEFNSIGKGIISELKKIAQPGKQMLEWEEQLVWGEYGPQLQELGIQMSQPANTIFNKILGDMGVPFTTYQMWMAYALDPAVKAREEVAEAMVEYFANLDSLSDAAKADPDIARAAAKKGVASSVFVTSHPWWEAQLMSAAGGYAVIPQKQIIDRFYGSQATSLLPTSITHGPGETNNPDGFTPIPTEKGFDYIPSKEFPCMSIIQVLNPKVMYQQTHSALASLLTRHIPPVELTKVMPYFNIQIETPTIRRPYGDAPQIDGFRFLLSGLNLTNSAGSQVAYTQGGLINQQSVAMGIEASYDGRPDVENGVARSNRAMSMGRSVYAGNGDTFPRRAAGEIFSGMNASPTAAQVGGMDPPGPYSGMELFTMPQSIVPMGQRFDPAVVRYGVNNRGIGKYSMASGQNVIIDPTTKDNNPKPAQRRDTAGSVDPSRPFMTVKSFKVQVTPTRGTMSSTRATLTATLHDRGRLKDIKSLLMPATLNQVEFQVQYGWTCNETANNVYSSILNNLRDCTVYTMYGVDYSFTDDGQIEITFKLVAKGSEIVNVQDAATTGKSRPAWQAVEEAMEAVQTARSNASSFLANKQIADISGTQYINTLSLDSTGTLISGDASADIKKWVAQLKTAQYSGDPPLDNLVKAVETLKSAVEAADETLQEELSKKLGLLKTSGLAGNGEVFASVLTDVTSVEEMESGEYPAKRFSRLAKQKWEQVGGGDQKPTTLGAVLQLFCAQPLAASGLYDEVQLVFYTANTEAGASAGSNLAAIPIDMRKVGSKTFADLLSAEYKRYGGQFPITRFINYIADNFVEPEFSLCYGLTGGSSSAGNPNYTYDSKSKQVVQKKITDRKKHIEAVTRSLRKFYYNDTSPGSALRPKPTPFKPIRLAVHFETLPSSPGDFLDQIGFESSQTLPSKVKLNSHTILKIHVVDQAASGDVTPLDVVKSARSTSAGVLVKPPDRSLAGMSDQLCNVLYGENQGKISYSSIFNELLNGVNGEGGIIQPVVVDTLEESPADAPEVKALQEKLVKLVSAYEEFMMQIAPPLGQAQGGIASTEEGMVAFSPTGLHDLAKVFASVEFTTLPPLPAENYSAQSQSNVTAANEAGTNPLSQYPENIFTYTTTNPHGAMLDHNGNPTPDVELIPDFDGGIRAYIVQGIQEVKDQIDKLRQEQAGNDGHIYQLVGSPSELIEFVANYYPTLVYGEEGSPISKIAIKSNSNSKSATIHMIRARDKDGDTNSSEPRGLPLRTMPMSVSVDMMGNPLIKYMQRFFIRADTGTTIDNLYAVTGIDHEITPDKYTTKLKLTVDEAFAAFEPLAEQLNVAGAGLRGIGRFDETEYWVGLGMFTYGRWFWEWYRDGEQHQDEGIYTDPLTGNDYYQTLENGMIVQERLGGAGSGLMDPDGNLVSVKEADTIEAALGSNNTLTVAVQSKIGKDGRERYTGTRVIGPTYRWKRGEELSNGDVTRGHLQIYDTGTKSYRAFRWTGPNKDPTPGGISGP